MTFYKYVKQESEMEWDIQCASTYGLTATYKKNLSLDLDHTGEFDGLLLGEIS